MSPSLGATGGVSCVGYVTLQRSLCTAAALNCCSTSLAVAGTVVSVLGVCCNCVRILDLVDGRVHLQAQSAMLMSADITHARTMGKPSYRYTLQSSVPAK